jgi:hypothetical protein
MLPIPGVTGDPNTVQLTPGWCSSAFTAVPQRAGCRRTA